jgi:hypothetical protein
LQAAEDDVVDPLCLCSPVACRVELPKAGQRQDHVVWVKAGPQGPVDGERATGESYCIAHHLFSEEGERKLMVAWLRYRDTFVKVGNTWLFGERNLYVD